MMKHCQTIAHGAALRLILLTLSGLLFLQPAAAQEKLSDGEDVAYAFYKTAGVQPDFTGWIKESKKYKTAAPARAPRFLSEERQRLLRNWQSMGDAPPMIAAKMEVAVELLASADAAGDQHYGMHILFKDGMPEYLPYQFAGHRFAVIPQMFETLVTQSLTKEQYTFLLDEFNGQPKGYAAMLLNLKPAQAYTEQPYKIDGVEQWALLCNIAGASLTSKNGGVPYWNYAADWYLSPKTEELRGLYVPPETKNPAVSVP